MKSVVKVMGFCCVLILMSSVAFAQTPDGQTPSDEKICDKLVGAAFGLCTAYCEANDCDLDSDKEDNKACGRLRNNFQRIMGKTWFPCDCVFREEPIKDPKKEADFLYLREKSEAEHEADKVVEPIKEIDKCLKKRKEKAAVYDKILY